MADLFDQLIKYWRRQDVRPAAAIATPEEIAQWEAKFGVRLPWDLREYVTRVNGTFKGEALEFGNDMMSFLPLNAIVPEAQWSEHYNEPYMFVFVDYLISSYWWCVRLTPHDSEYTQVFVRSSELKLVSTSVEEFLLAYMSDSKAIHP